MSWPTDRKWLTKPTLRHEAEVSILFHKGGPSLRTATCDYFTVEMNDGSNLAGYVYALSLPCFLAILLNY